MIRQAPPLHYRDMDAPDLAVPGVVQRVASPERERDARITAIVRTHHDFIWRLLRRLGIPQAHVDDATQQVFCIAVRRVDDIAPGSERSFLFGTAVRVASDKRRSARQREQSDEKMGEVSDPGPSPEELADKRRARVVLDQVLAEMPMELRTVLVLFELEQMTKGEVAELLGIPVGTAVSRLRRAREDFKACARRRLARDALGKGRP